jgi:tetratricopeptide (TPR) repeat protein
MNSPDLPFDPTGDLASQSLAVLLLGLYKASFEGTLCLDAPQRSKRLTFQKGAPVQAESNLSSETLGLQLVEQGLISPDQHKQVCAYVKKKSCKEGVALLALKLIEPKDLFAGLKEQVRRRIRECFAWPDGQYQIEACAPQGEANLAFRGDPLAIVQGGLESHWTVEKIFSDLSSRLKEYPNAAPQLRRHLARLEPDPALETLAAGLDGTQTFENLVGPAFASPRALAGVWVLAHSGALTWSEAPIDLEADSQVEFEADIELQVDATAEKPGARSITTPRAAKRRAVIDGSSDKAKAARTEIENRRASLGKSDHYALLGVEPNAKAVVIKKAYFKAAKQYHPDTLVKLGLEDLHDTAAEVFAQIAGAFEVLSDQGKRKDYDASLRGELTEAQATQLAQAETSYRKGEILIRMGDFKGALEYLRPAVEIWPDEAAYQSALGWALYKATPSDPEQARIHLEHALRIDQNDPVTHFRLGTLLRNTGETDEGAKLLKRAAQLEPNRG